MIQALHRTSKMPCIFAATKNDNQKSSSRLSVAIEQTEQLRLVRLAHVGNIMSQLLHLLRFLTQQHQRRIMTLLELFQLIARRLVLVH